MRLSLFYMQNEKVQKLAESNPQKVLTCLIATNPKNLPRSLEILQAVSRIPRFLPFRVY